VREGVDSLVGELAIADDAIAPGQYGRAQLRGSTWTARNVGERTTIVGERSRVVAVRGLELDIRPERGA
jgi:membrane protein implicated in regulation of membrane protease activity